MESLENKILQQKLNELEDVLPEGGQPSLDGKWAMLELALAPEAEPRRRFFLPWAAAAVFFLLAGVWWMQYSAGHKQAEQAAAVSVPPAKVQEQAERAVAEPSLAVGVKQKSHPTKKHRPIRSETSIILAAAPEPRVTEQEKILTDSVQETQPLQLAKRPHKKARMLEIDFNEPAIGPAATGVAENSPAPSRLRVGIGSVARVKAKDAEQSSPVKLLTTF